MLITPLVSELTGEGGRGLEDGTHVDYDEARTIREALDQLGIKHLSVVQAKQLMVAMGAGVVPNSVEPPNYEENILAPSELEEKLRVTIDRTVKRVTKGEPTKIIEINQQLKTIFGSRTNAPIATLQMIIRYLSDTYGEVI